MLTVPVNLTVEDAAGDAELAPTLLVGGVLVGVSPPLLEQAARAVQQQSPAASTAGRLILMTLLLVLLVAGPGSRCRLEKRWARRARSWTRPSMSCRVPPPPRLVTDVPSARRGKPHGRPHGSGPVSACLRRSTGRNPGRRCGRTCRTASGRRAPRGGPRCPSCGRGGR